MSTMPTARQRGTGAGTFDSEMDDHRDVVVVGAGIAGLSAAWELHRAGRDVLLVEAEAHVGGVIRSEPIEGVGVLDLGPQTVRSRDPDLFDHFEELGIAGDRIVAGDAGKSRYIVLNGELVALPHSPPSFIGSKVLSAGAKLRLLTEPLRGTRPGEDESVREFFAQRLGPEVADRLVDPFVSGVYAGNPERLSMRAVFPDLKNGVDEAGSLLRWGLGLRRSKSNGGKADEAESKPKRPAELFSFPEGLERWPRAIVEALGDDRVRTGHRMIDAHRDGDDWVVEFEGEDGGRTVRCTSLILAVPASRVRAALGEPDVPSDAIEGLDAIPYSPVSTVHTAYRRDSIEHPLDGFGYLCPSSEKRKALGVLWISSLFPSRVEDGRVLLTTFVGGARQPEHASESEEWLIETAYGEHRRFLGANSPPLFAKVQRWPQAIPQYEFGHLDRVADADRLEARHPGLHLTGAWRDGVSVTDCWKGGRRVAREILDARPAGRTP